MFQREIVVRFNDCDGLGHVNNATYFTYMEDARMEIFRLFNPSLDLQSWNLIAASTKCDFLQQVKYAEKLTVFTWVSRLGNSSFDVDHAIQNEKGAWVARGQVTLIAYDYVNQKAIPLWPEVRSALSDQSTGPQGVPALR